MKFLRDHLDKAKHNFEKGGKFESTITRTRLLTPSYSHPTPPLQVKAFMYVTPWI